MARGNGEGTIVKRKDGRWMGAITIGKKKNGGIKRKYVYGKKRKEVAEKMTRIKNELLNNSYVEPSDLMLKEWLYRWIEGRKSSLAYSTYNNYKVMIRNHLEPDIGDISLNDLSSRMIQELLNEKLENGRIDSKGGLSVRTVKYIYQTLHAALEQAVKENLIRNNPSKAVELPKKQEEKKLKTWNQKQVYIFLSTAKKFNYYPLMFLAVHTGMRKGELLGLKWEDISFEKKRIEVKRQLARTDKGLIFKKVKTDSGNRIIPITDNIVRILKNYRLKQKETKLMLGEQYNNLNLVGANKIGKPIDPRNLYREFKKIIKKANLQEIRFHDLRHTFATLFLEAGGAIKTLQQILGHSSITVTIDTYSHVTEQMLIDAEKKIKEMFAIK